MANQEVVNIVIDMVSEMILYLLPVIGFLAGVFFVLSFLMYVIFGQTRRNFRD